MSTWYLKYFDLHALRKDYPASAEQEAAEGAFAVSIRRKTV